MFDTDGGQEVIAARFIHPAEALEEHKAQKMRFMPPQFYILSTLAEILKGSVNTAEQREQVEALSGGAFGKLVINPLGIGKDDTGRQILAYEGDEGRGGPKGRLHRAFVQFGGKGVNSFVALGELELTFCFSSGRRTDNFGSELRHFQRNRTCYFQYPFFQTLTINAPD